MEDRVAELLEQLTHARLRLQVEAALDGAVSPDALPMPLADPVTSAALELSAIL